jgi:hypothetical protein
MQAEESFKGLRRKLPKTKQEFNWQVMSCLAFCNRCFRDAYLAPKYRLRGVSALPLRHFIAGAVPALSRARAHGAYAHQEQLDSSPTRYIIACHFLAFVRNYPALQLPLPQTAVGFSTGRRLPLQPGTITCAVN